MIGVEYPDTYAVEETFQLLKVPWEWYDSGKQYEAVIRLSKSPGDAATSGTDLDISGEDPFRKVADTLDEGLPRNREPVVEQVIDRLRSRLVQRAVLPEIPPVPWGHPYILALTHDVDVLSVRERRWLSVLAAIYDCVSRGAIGDAARIFGAKLGIGKDPWNLIEEWMRFEEELGVRSTFFFLPFRDSPGSDAPPIRAGHYSPDPRTLRSLADGGWEVGVHGIDNWKDAGRGAVERKAISDLGIEVTGTRVHWLLFGRESWAALDEAGYGYDTTFGYNEDIGFRAGTLQAFQPRGAGHLLELPLHIQDLALFGRSCWATGAGGRWSRVPCLGLGEEGALAACDGILAAARRYGGAVTLLWHHESLGPPRRWAAPYASLVQRAKADGAWIARAADAVGWFRMRREVRIEVGRTGRTIRIRLEGLGAGQGIPLLRLRLHLGKERVRSVNEEWVAGDGFADIRCGREDVQVELA